MNIGEITRRLSGEELDEKLISLYVDKTMIEYQRTRYLSALSHYTEQFDSEDVQLYSAPGRTEVCGNHTDHQHGHVLAASVNLDTIAVCSAQKERRIEIASEGYGQICVDLNDISYKEEEKNTSISLVRGVVKYFEDNGYRIGGFTAYITSNVLAGAGLSSSASFEVLIGTILSGMYNENKISKVEIAKAARYAENVYFGKPCGLMDQMACSEGGLISIDFRDTNQPIIEKMNLNLEEHGYSLCVVDTKGSHADLSDDYAAIPTEMKEVAACFEEEVLREVKKEELLKNISNVREQTIDRSILRALHFFMEEEHVKEATDAVLHNDFTRFLQCIEQSGNSSYKYLQNVYTLKDTKRQSLSLALAMSDMFLQNRGVSRVHGGGFAGTIQAFVENDTVKDYKAFMEAVFGKDACQILQISSLGGYKVIE